MFHFANFHPNPIRESPMTEQATNGAAGAASQNPNQPVFALQRVYIKDASYEAPNAPQIFQEQAQPELQLNLGQKVNKLGEGVFEVILTVSLTCTVNSKNAYLAEVQQAGIFTVAGFDAQNTDGLLGTYAPNTLFPYARRAISDLVQDGGFPPFLLQPINFEQVYADVLRKRQEQAQEAQAAATDATPSPDAGHA